jgi:hypothetical protein
LARSASSRFFTLVRRFARAVVSSSVLRAECLAWKRSVASVIAVALAPSSRGGVVSYSDLRASRASVCIAAISVSFDWMRSGMVALYSRRYAIW